MASDAMLRWLRAATLPPVLFTSGLVSHAAAGGVIPGGSVLVPLFVLTVVAAASFARAAITPMQAAALLIGSQGLLHAALHVLGDKAATVTTTMCHGAMDAAGSSPTGPHLISSHLMTQPGAPASHGFAISPMSSGQIIMPLAHLAVVVVVGVWLAAGDRAFWTFLIFAARPVAEAWRTVREAARDRIGAVVGCSPLVPPGMHTRPAVSSSVLAMSVVSRRGPPKHSFA
jgi:hypothetical protein